MSDASKNGSESAERLKKALADSSRFQFKEDTLDLGEHVNGVVLHLKSLSVAEREALPDLTKTVTSTVDGKQVEKEVPDSSVAKLAAVFAAVVSKLEVDGEFLDGISGKDAEGFLGAWPAEANDAVLEKFGEITGTGEEKSAAAGTFPERK